MIWGVFVALVAVAAAVLFPLAFAIQASAGWLGLALVAGLGLLVLGALWPTERACKRGTFAWCRRCGRMLHPNDKGRRCTR